ncbi:MAG: hypothetical protein GY765_34610, partial [bacterium]|nr:hypothetical protein [bacterium]
MAYTKQPKILSLLSTYFLFFNLYLLFPQTAGKTPGTGFLPSLDPSKKISQYVYDTWTKEDGLPSDSIWAITQTTDGYLWLGTFHGLVRFNGVDFKVFNRDNIPQLTNNRISALWAKKNGGLWIGTESDGLLLYNKGKFTQYDVHKGLPDNWVLSIMEDHKGDTWIGSTMGLARLHKGNVTTMTPEKDAGDFYGIMEESPGIVWFCSRNSGLFRLESGEFRKYTTADGLSGNDVKGICKDKEGTLWISCEYHGLNYYRNGKFSPYDDATVTTDKFIATLLCDRAGTIWVDSFYGLRRLKRPPGGRDAYVLDIFTPADGLTDSRIRSIFEDREGNLWVGTYKGGLNRFKDGCLTTMTSSEGLAQNFIRALFEDSRGNVWVGTNRNGVNLINGESITHYTTADGLPTNCIRCFEEDGTGTIWIGTTRGLISYKNGGFIKTPPTAETLFNHSIRCIYAPSQGVVAPSHGVVAPSHGVVAPPPGDAITLWVGTYNGGLIYLKNNAFTYVPLSPPLDSAKTTWIREYPPQSGTMWVGTSRGLLRMKEGRHTLYSKNDGLNVPNLTTVFIDDAGTFWLGTSGGGLYRFKDGSFFPYTTSDGLVDDSIWSIYEDRNHRFWFSCDSGIFRIHRRELKSFAGGKINRLNAVVFGKQDGMKSTECNGGGNPFIVHRKQMQLWYPTAGGITRVTPCALKTKTLPPPVRIEDIRIGGLSREPGMKAPVPAGKKDFEFHYAALSYSNPRGIRYKYKLVGYNEHWVDAENRRIAYYTNLLPGEYTFKVVAANVGSDWNMEGAHKSFVLEARFYQTYWFYSLLALLLAAVITLGYRLRVAAVHSRNRQLLKEIAERKRAEEQLKHLRNLLKNIIDSMP